MKASKVLEMTEKEMLPISILKISIEEFSRVQTYMISSLQFLDLSNPRLNMVF